MLKMVLSAAIAAAALVPVASFADDAMGHAMPAPEMMGTMVCRTAHAGEKPSATMMGQGTALVCKPVADMMKAGKMAGPDLSKALTSQQADEAWQKWVAQVLVVPVTPP